ncbi:unnamed protein product [Notodromas monacha]|uniref:Uncharacterized protein n=1 Tax=Notodromas monacha TaxID=399045 RepID=A0A7R9BK61_9CRUS|nr:unnamed protein product [Notodromas monacha]CAG0917002.1 unnamed protein product [Notodromas monacha]
MFRYTKELFLAAVLFATLATESISAEPDQETQPEEFLTPRATWESLITGLFPGFGKRFLADMDRNARLTSANKPLVTYNENTQALNVAFPSKTSEFSSLSNQPRTAVVTLTNLAGSAFTTTGKIIFFQENMIQSVSLVGNIVTVPAAARTGLRLEIRSTASDDCTNVGQLFNPTGAENGGLISSTGIAAANGVWGFYTTALPIYRISLYDPNSILGRAVLLSQNGVNLACGRILAA